MVDPSPATTVTYQWNTARCFTSFRHNIPTCFPANQTTQSVTDNNLLAEDAGTITCTVTIDGVNYTSGPLTLRISGIHTHNEVYMHAIHSCNKSHKGFKSDIYIYIHFVSMSCSLYNGAHKLCERINNTTCHLVILSSYKSSTMELFVDFTVLPSILVNSLFCKIFVHSYDTAKLNLETRT